ncbi:extracellular matrix protein 2 [Takifugu rubripes]|uniref:extracellular matrix protein 2 n=1 Tax=Takifugu rubripes TaxID=31033 RepID=UPI001145CE76|nr:extracellular matrix protein 2 [Takifugu rubripes]
MGWRRNLTLRRWFCASLILSCARTVAGDRIEADSCLLAETNVNAIFLPLLHKSQNSALRSENVSNSQKQSRTTPGAPSEAEEKRKTLVSSNGLHTTEMRWWLVGAGLWLLLALAVSDIQARNNPPGHGCGLHREKRRRTGSGKQCLYQGLTMFDQAMWSPTSCVTCLCTGGQVVCEEVSCPTMHCYFPFTPVGECCPICMESGPHNSVTQERICREEEEEQLRKKKEAKKKRRKKEEQVQKQRRLVKERGAEQQPQRRKLEKDEEAVVDEDEARRWKDAMERQAREMERELEEERRRQEENLRRRLQAVTEEEQKQLEEELKERAEEVDEWMEKVREEEEEIRGDVFQSPPKEPDQSTTSRFGPPAETEDEMMELEEEEGERVENRHGLPPGCGISDVTVTCDGLKLAHFPPLSIAELKSLSLEDNNISSIPAESFNGIPNLEWINLSKNQLSSAAIDPKAFTGLKFLRRLYLNGNLLEVVPNNLPSTLQELKISDNKLRGVDENSFRDLSNLVILELEGNLLSEGNVDPRAFAPLIHLSYLRLGRNYFRTVPQGLPPSLLELYLENNLIEEISEAVFNQTENLNVVSLSHNRLDETSIAPMAWIDHRNLESIDLSHNQLFLVPSYLPRSLVNLLLVGNHIERIPAFVFAHMDPGLEYLYLSYNKLDEDGIEPESFFGSYSSMVELCLDHNQLVTVPSGISEMSNLHFLRLNNNKIRRVPEESICDPDKDGDPNLVVLRLENNYIDSKTISPTAFSCVHATSSVILKPQKTK